jgi:hypothetical protein
VTNSDGSITISANFSAPAWGDITEKPETFPPSPHSYESITNAPWLLSFTELDPVFSAWLLATPPLYEYTETDPVAYPIATNALALTQANTNYTLLTLGDGGYPGPRALHTEHFRWSEDRFELDTNIVAGAAAGVTAVQPAETRQVTIDAENAHTNRLGGHITILGSNIKSTSGLVTPGAQGAVSLGFSTSATGAEGATAFGSSSVASGSFGATAMGYEANASNDASFVFNGDISGGGYGSHGDGTFSVNPVGGAGGFWIGAETLAGLLSKATSTPHPIAYATNVTISADNGMEQRIVEITGPMDITFPAGVTNLLTRIFLTIPPTGTNEVDMIAGPSYTFITPLTSEAWVGTNAYTHVWYVSEHGTTNSTAIVARGSVQ